MSPTSMATARFMETWAHALDVAEALGITPEPTDRIRHVAHLGVRTRNFAFGVHALEPPAEEFRVELRRPSGELWEWGPDDAAQSVPARRTTSACASPSAGTATTSTWSPTGPDADRWLDIAQAFAGPPGEGRAADRR